ncbi:MAG: SDR family NAD(P)-dependent oxidoreductase [Flavobacteriales bacterium]
MKTAVIIGGNSGIGKATAKALAAKQYRVIIHGRNPEKTKAALEEIKTASKNSNVEAVVGDFNTIAGMKKTAAEIQSKTDVIDILVLSTGVIYNKRIETPDGLEAAFVGQYLGRFALTQLLMPQLKKSQFARIAMVGAPTMKKAKIHFEDISLKNKFSMMTSMGQAMLSSHLFVQEFAKRHKNENVVMNIHHVGIAKTGVTREISPFLRGMFNLIGTSADKAAKNTVYLADNDEVKFSGYFLPKPGKPEKKNLIQFDAALAEKLWDYSLGLIK